MAVAERMTAEQYLALEPTEGDPPRAELIDGEVVVNSPRPLHQLVPFDLASALRAWTHEQPGRGTVTLHLDVLLAEHSVFEPDILWYAEGRAPTRTDEPPSPLPDLTIEIRSFSTWRYDIGTKKAGYERRGLPELWLVDTPPPRCSPSDARRPAWRASTPRSNSPEATRSNLRCCPASRWP